MRLQYRAYNIVLVTFRFYFTVTIVVKNKNEIVYELSHILKIMKEYLEVNNYIC